MKKIAVLILAHKYPKQLERLLIHMDDVRFDFYIHVDAKSPIAPFQYLKQVTKHSKVIFTKNRIKTYFNDFSLVEATCSIMTEATSKNEPYMYYVLLTGQDYPIKSNNHIYQTLTENYPMSYIDMYGVEYAFNNGVKWVGRIGYKYFSQSFRRKILNLVGNKFYFSRKGTMVKILPVMYDKVMTTIGYSPRKKISQTAYIYSAGSHFWILPNIAVQHILDKFETDSNINNIFRHISAPEESYFQTVLSTMKDLRLPCKMLDQFSTPEKEMDNPALRLIKWYENGIHTNGHPAIWNTDDIDTIDNAKALFARKFDMNINSDIIDYLDKTR